MSEYPMPPSYRFGAATFQGFNLPGGKRYLMRVAFWATVLLMAVYILLGAPILKGALEFAKKIIAVEMGFLEPSGSLDLISFVMSVAIYYFLIVFCHILILTSAETAIYRNLLHDENKGFFPLRFGSQELRVLGTRLIIGLILGALVLGAAGLGAIVAVAVFDTSLKSLAEEMTGPRVGMMSLLYFIVVAVLVWMSVRLAPASAYSVKSRAFRPLGSWKAMRGFVWRGIGSVLILFVLGAIILSVVYFILLSILLFSSGIFQAGLKIWQSPDGLAEFFLTLIENLTSASFIIPLLGVLFTFVFLAIIWWGLVWAMWGYFAKLDGRGQSSTDELADKIW